MVYHSGYKSFICLIWGSYSSDDEEDSNQRGLDFISVQVVGFLCINSDEYGEQSNYSFVCIAGAKIQIYLHVSYKCPQSVAWTHKFYLLEMTVFKEVNAVKSALLYFSGHVIS